jgi:hypothetical protein
MKPDYLKALIQKALWDTYKATGNEDYREAYDLWVNNYESIILSQSAAMLGTRGGSAKSEIKQNASRENGKKGGRPRRA